MGKKKAKARSAALEADLERLSAIRLEMNLMSELDALRLQMMMDRRSKLFETLSNVLKKIAKEQEAIIRALK